MRPKCGTKHGAHFEPLKYVLIHFTRNQNRESTASINTMNEIKIGPSSEAKYLRVIFDQTVEKSLSSFLPITPRPQPPPLLQPHLHHAIFVYLPMSRGTELPEILRAQIVILTQRGDSWAEIGAFLGVHPDTVRKTYLRWEINKTFSSASRSGRPKSLTERDVRHIAKHITSNRDTRRQALGEIINVLYLSVCPKTLHKTITNDIGLGHRIERKKPWLSPQQKADRLKFALDHIHWTEEDWMRVVWTDEMSMQTDANQGRKWI